MVKKLLRPSILHLAKNGGFTAITAGISLGLAWSFPGEVAAVLLSWFGVLLLVRALRQGVSKLSLLLAGLLYYSIGVHWLPDVLSTFFQLDGFHKWIAFSTFCIFAATQFYVVGIVYSLLPDGLEKYSLRSAVAWMVAAVLWPSVFSAQVGHTQLAFLPLAQVAALGGVELIGLLMFWGAESLYSLRKERRISSGTVVCGAVFFAALLFGVWQLAYYPKHVMGDVKIAAIQAQLSEDSKIKQFQAHLGELSKTLEDEVDLIVWPNRATTAFVHESIGNASRDALLPEPLKSTPILLAAYTYRPPVKTFSSALLIEPGGHIPMPYHKQTLVPLSEYLPLKEFLPWPNWVRTRLENEVTAGTEARLYKIETKEDKASVQVAPLVCYEDVDPAIARKATQAGAEVLIDLANGGWGQSELAPRQHHTMASFRAIENRRALVRVAAVGVSGAVLPSGRTVNAAPFSSEAVLQFKLPTYSGQTFYTAYVGSQFWRLISWITLFISILWRGASLIRPGRRSELLPC